MDDARSTLDLWDYRRQVLSIYRRVRQASDPRTAWEGWRAARDALFATHPQSPYGEQAREGLAPLPYFAYDPAWRLELDVLPLDAASESLAHSSAGATLFQRFGRVAVPCPGGATTDLVLYWLDSYGGGVFLPFLDATNGIETYGGGRYLLDTAKGADLGHAGDRVVLDFNFAYHPSCAHDVLWSCPLAPRENRFAGRVEAGERLRPWPV